MRGMRIKITDSTTFITDLHLFAIVLFVCKYITPPGYYLADVWRLCPSSYIYLRKGALTTWAFRLRLRTLI